MNTFIFSEKPQILTVFNFTHDTKEFIGSADAYIPPNTGLPDFCTLVSPSEQKIGFTYIWKENEWVLMEDHRGEVVFDKTSGQKIIITELGALPESVTTISPANAFDYWNGEGWQPSVSDAKHAKIQQIKAHRDTLTADYIIIDGHHFHSDASSRIQQLSLTKMGQAKQVPPGLMWQTKNHGLIELTNEIAAQFETVTLEHDMRLFANAQRHIAAVEALEDIQAVLDYDYTPGWQP